MKIGDRVRVVKFLDIDVMDGYAHYYLNKTGEIIYQDAITIESDPYPLRINFDDDNLNRLGYVFYNEEELETIN